MVFQAALSGTNYFKRPPLYHNRIKKREKKKRISPISGSPKPSTRELIIEPRAFLSQSATQIYLFWKSRFAPKNTALAQNSASPLMSSQPLNGRVNRFRPQNESENPRPASTTKRLKCYLCCNGLQINLLIL